MFSIEVNYRNIDPATATPVATTATDADGHYYIGDLVPEDGDDNGIQAAAVMGQVP